MKKLFLTLTIGLAALAGQAQTAYSMLRAVHPDDFKT